MGKQVIRVLFVEDELSLAEIVKESLEHRGFEVTHAISLKTAMEAFSVAKPDIIILDVMLGDGSGFKLASDIRKSDMETKIIFLTAKSLPQDVVLGFECGGNDYLKKPFSLEELVVRIKVLLSRNQLLSPAPNEEISDIQLGKFLFSYRRNSLIFNNRSLSLTARESELLKLLTTNSHRIIDRKILLDTIWGDDNYFAGRSLDVFITKLRKHLSADPTVQILNIRGVGYKLIH